MTKSVFARNRAVDFTLFDKQFQQWLRLLVLYVEERGGVPVTTTTRYRGKNIGQWYAQVCAQPHTLTEAERTALRAVPGVYLTPAAKPRREVVMGPDRAYLWKRLKLWAENPTADPVTRRRWEFFYKHRKDTAAAAATATDPAVAGTAGAAGDAATGGSGDAKVPRDAATTDEPAGDVAAGPSTAAAPATLRGRDSSARRRARREASRGVAPVLQREA